MALGVEVCLFLAQQFYKVICCNSGVLQVELEEFNVGVWVVLSVECACVGMGIPVDKHSSSLCFVEILQECLQAGTSLV